MYLRDNGVTQLVNVRSHGRNSQLLNGNVHTYFEIHGLRLRLYNDIMREVADKLGILKCTVKLEPL